MQAMSRMLASHAANASKNAPPSGPENPNSAHSKVRASFAISRKFWFISVSVRFPRDILPMPALAAHHRLLKRNH
jgi:hypothetical protein